MSTGLGTRTCKIQCANPCFRSKLVSVPQIIDNTNRNCRVPLKDCHGVFLPSKALIMEAAL